MSERDPWRCRHGLHRWRFVSMSNLRLPDVTGSDWICTLVERCQGCRLGRTRHHATPPRFPRRYQPQDPAT